MLTAETDRKEVRIAWLMLIGCPLSFLAIMVPVLMGVSPGVDAGHPEIYLEATCIAWAIVSTVPPILRLTRLVSLPWFFLMVVYADMYFYVLSLNMGLYLNVSWWGDMGHVISSMVVTMIVFVALCIVELHSPPHVTFGNRIGFTTMLFIVSLSFGGIWEMIEGFTDFAGGGSYMVYGATDTMGDLTADLIGAMIVSIAVCLILRDIGPRQIASEVRVGRSSFKIGDENGMS